MTLQRSRIDFSPHDIHLVARSPPPVQEGSIHVAQEEVHAGPRSPAPDRLRFLAFACVSCYQDTRHRDSTSVWVRPLISFSHYHRLIFVQGLGPGGQPFPAPTPGLRRILPERLEIRGGPSSVQPNYLRHSFRACRTCTLDSS